ncbi:hypothetical protein BH10BAC2_BH10BAC2_31180 [soil metagenome]
MAFGTERGKMVFENAYNEILKNDFKFKIDYPSKFSKDRKKTANISLEKTTTTTTVFVQLSVDGNSYSVKLFDKKNWWMFDSVYVLVKGNKWFDNDRFCLSYKPSRWNVWCSVKESKVYFELNGIISKIGNLDKIFKF